MKSEKVPLKLEDLEIYQLAMEIGEGVWGIVCGWDYFEKKYPGGQFADAADSIAANIAEGHGRYFFKRKTPVCLLQQRLAFGNQNLGIQSLRSKSHDRKRTRQFDRKTPNPTL